jgi:hypothetical protein
VRVDVGCPTGSTARIEVALDDPSTTIHRLVPCSGDHEEGAQ